MTTITIKLEQPSLVEELKAYLSSIKGILSVSVSEKKHNIPNRTTRRVIEDARKGKNLVACKSFDDYLRQMDIALKS